MDNVDKDFQKAVTKRNFYNTNDVGKVYLYAVIVPLVITLIFSFVCSWIAQLAGMEFADGENWLQTLYQNFLWFSIPYSLITQISFVIIYFTYNKVNRISLKATKLEFKKINPIVAIACAVLGILFVIGFYALIEGCFGTLFEMWGILTDESPIPLNNFGWYVFYIVVFALVPAICEEVIFRGIIFSGLKRGIGSLWAIILSSLLFALIHQKINQFIYPFILGVVVATIMNKTNNIFYTILLHFFNNLTTVTIQYLLNIGALNLNFEVGAVYVIVALILALVVAVIFVLFYFFYLRKKEFAKTKDEGEDFIGIEPIFIGKLPLTLYAGMAISVIFIVINIVAR